MKRTLAQMAIAASLAMAGVAFADEPMNPYETPPPPPPAQPINPYGNGYGYGYGAGMDAPPLAAALSASVGVRLSAADARSIQLDAAGLSAGLLPLRGAGHTADLLRATAGGVRSPPPHLSAALRRASRSQEMGRHSSLLDRHPRHRDGINQKVGSNDVITTGAVFSCAAQGHFAVEFSQSFLHANYWNGGFVRNGFPFDVSLMGYVFKNEDRRHFNLSLFPRRRGPHAGRRADSFSAG